MVFLLNEADTERRRSMGLGINYVILAFHLVSLITISTRPLLCSRWFFPIGARTDDLLHRGENVKHYTTIQLKLK
jgi:hypothetical protein